MESRLTTWCNRFIRIGFYLLFGLIPLLLTPWNYELFEYNKMMAVYTITAFVATAWLTKMIHLRELKIARTPLDIPIWLFVTSQFLSALFSIDPHVSWLGYYSRFNGGMWSVISYVLLYYAYMSNRSNNTNETRLLAPERSDGGQANLLKTALASATLVAIYGVLERLGIDKHLWVQDVQNRVFSTLGQPNWLAAYLAALVPIGLAFAIQQFTKKNRQGLLSTSLYGLITLLFFAVLLFTRSRSGLLGFIVADIVFWGLFFIRPPRACDKNRKGAAFFRLPVILHLLFALIVFVNGTGTPTIDRFITFNGWRDLTNKLTTQQSNKATQEATPSATVAGPALEVGGTESGVIRKYVWQGAINAWKSSIKTFLIGTGTETFAFAFYQFRPAGHNATSEWDFLYNKAHNEYLNYLATTGLFGLGSYLLFIGTFIWWFIQHMLREMRDEKNKKNQIAHHSSLITHALFSGWLSILVTNFFGFSVVILQVFLFLFPALIFASTHSLVHPSSIKVKFPFWTTWPIFFIGVVSIFRIATYWYADTKYASGYRQIRAGIYGQAVPSLLTAIAVNPAEPTYHDELGNAYATLSVAAFEANNATQAAQLASLAVEENTKAINTSPRNVNYYKTRTKVYYTLSSLEPSFNAKAIEALKIALTLSPNDPKIYYNLAILVGREGESEQAIQYLKKAKTLKPNYRDVYYALWVFFTEDKKQNEARAILQEYLNTVDPNDKDFLERLK